MMLRNQEESLDHVERVLQQSLGRELTAREKFYIALAEAARSKQQACSSENASCNPN